MLRRLVLQNFKSWKKVEVSFRPITLIYGANISGKSSLLQFLLLLKQTKDSNDPQVALDFSGALTDLGSFRDAVFQHDDENMLTWDMMWSLPKVLNINNPAKTKPTRLFYGDELAIKVEVAAKRRQVETQYMAYHFDKASFLISRKEDKSRHQLDTHETDYRFVRTLGRVWDLPEPTKGYSYPDQAQTYFQNAQFLRLFESSYVEQIDSLLYLGPLREDPQRQYTWSGSNPSDVGPRAERTVEAILAADERREKRNVRKRQKLMGFQETIAWWLRELGLIESFQVRELSEGSGLFRVFVKKTAASSEAALTDVGFGVSQILPVLTLLYYAPEGSSILMEQPEIHLHPAVQAGLADLFISVAKVRRLQLIVESHSEHLLTRMMRRIAERETAYGDVSSDDVAVYFAENVEGKSNLQVLRLNADGVIENWPIDFFGDQLGEIVARETAVIKRRRRVV